MFRTIRIWMSRVFAVGLIMMAFHSVVLPTAPPVSSFIHSSSRLTAASSTPASVRPRLVIPRPTNATLCLAQVLYFEAATEPMEGMEAVAATVFNRVGVPGYAPSICGVVYQPYQYSWTSSVPNWRRRPPSMFFDLAKTFLQERVMLEETYPVTHFHRADIDPSWSQSLEYVTTIGQHKFYRGL